MSDIQDQISAVRTQFDELEEQLERHSRVVEGIGENPGKYDAQAAEDYLSTLQSALSEVDAFDRAAALLEPLEAATDAVEQAVLEGARVFIDDHEIEGVELIKFDDSPEVMEASILVESPKVNQLRGGRPLLELPDGREYTFSIRQTLIAEVSEDKSGHLELVLGLDEI